MNTTLNTIKLYTDNGPTWNIVCDCKSCQPKGWLKVSVEQMAELVDQAGVNFTDYKQLRHLSHNLIQAQK